jgi:tRNA-binding EMAP/Myf-like protein
VSTFTRHRRDQTLTFHSPKDAAILEAAYLKNSKPDKTERAFIVSQVDLGEKEVQVRTSTAHVYTERRLTVRRFGFRIDVKMIADDPNHYSLTNS